MADDEHFVLIESCEAGQQRAIVAKAAVAVQFDKVFEHQRDIVGRVRPILMPRDLHNLPRREIAINLPRDIVHLTAHAAEFFFLFGSAGRRLSQSAQLSFERQNRRFEFQTWCAVAGTVARDVGCWTAIFRETQHEQEYYFSDQDSF
jgi:hypothetical protein